MCKQKSDRIKYMSVSVSKPQQKDVQVFLSLSTNCCHFSKNDCDASKARRDKLTH